MNRFRSHNSAFKKPVEYPLLYLTLVIWYSYSGDLKIEIILSSNSSLIPSTLGDMITFRARCQGHLQQPNFFPSSKHLITSQAWPSAWRNRLCAFQNKTSSEIFGNPIQCWCPEVNFWGRRSRNRIGQISDAFPSFSSSFISSSTLIILFHQSASHSSWKDNLLAS
jgi:hypothetical protein